MKSYDSRFSNAKEDIWQHTITSLLARFL